MNLELEPGIVLSTRPLKESDLSVTILTKHLGKISAIAKGARKSKKRFPSGIDVFNCGVFELATIGNKEKIFLINAISKQESWFSLSDNLRKFTLASSMLELTQSFSADEDSDASDLFEPLFRSLRSLNQETDERTLDAVSQYYILRLLQHSGLNPLEDSPAVSSICIQWWREMTEISRPIKPHNQQLLKESLGFLIGYCENQLGYALKTKESLFAC